MSEPFVIRTRDSYSRIAAQVAEVVGAERTQPLERALLGLFAGRVRACRNTVVADVGCGAGKETARLAQLGLDPLGIDLAPGMIDAARRRYPGVWFAEGSMLSLPLRDGCAGGVLASYSIIHVPWALRPRVLAEFYRVLAPGGQVMLRFQVGSEQGRRSEAFGQHVSIDWYRQQPGDLADLLREAGLATWLQVVRAPEDGERTEQGRIIAGKSPLPSP